jgi:hypothetical protein
MMRQRAESAPLREALKAAKEAAENGGQVVDSTKALREAKAEAEIQGHMMIDGSGETVPDTEIVADLAKKISNGEPVRTPISPGAEAQMRQIAAGIEPGMVPIEAHQEWQDTPWWHQTERPVAAPVAPAAAVAPAQVAAPAAPPAPVSVTTTQPTTAPVATPAPPVDVGPVAPAQAATPAPQSVNALLGDPLVGDYGDPPPPRSAPAPAPTEREVQTANIATTRVASIPEQFRAQAGQEIQDYVALMAQPRGSLTQSEVEDLLMLEQQMRNLFKEDFAAFRMGILQ